MTATDENPPLPEPAGNWALFLDIDGTLLDIAPTPEAVSVPPDLPHCLQEVTNALGGAVALVSGRPVPWMDRVLAPLRICAAGQHGAELRLTAGAPLRAVAAPDDLNPIRRRIEGAIKEWPGVVIEPKSFGIGVHFRLAPERAGDVRRLLEEIATDAGGRYELLPGKMLIELKPAGPTKGRVVAAFMATAPFAGRVPVFVGDDRTDEDGFKEVLARGGHAIQVGPGVSAVASSFVANPAALRSWLKHILTVVRGAVA
jgi:trehalose 6-phosphate phosphatase